MGGSDGLVWSGLGVLVAPAATPLPDPISQSCKVAGGFRYRVWVSIFRIWVWGEWQYQYQYQFQFECLAFLSSAASGPN